MSTTVISLINAVRSMSGDEGTDQRYTDANLRDQKIVQGMRHLSAVYHQQFTTTGSGDSAYFSPDPDDDEIQLLILFSAIEVLTSDLAAATNAAVVHSNPAGKTDLSRVPKAISSLIKGLEQQATDIITKREHREVESEIEAKEMKGKETSESEGLPVMTITWSK